MHSDPFTSSTVNTTSKVDPFPEVAVSIAHSLLPILLLFPNHLLLPTDPKFLFKRLVHSICSLVHPIQPSVEEGGVVSLKSYVAVRDLIKLKRE